MNNSIGIILSNDFTFGGIITPISNTGIPVISSSGEFKTGYALTTTNGTWTGSPTSYTYQWQKNGTNIGGATTNQYTPVDADAGTNITCEVTANKAGTSSVMAESAAVQVEVLTDLEFLVSWQNPADLIPVPVGASQYWNQITTVSVGTKLSNIVTSSNAASTIGLEHLIDATSGGSMSLDTGTSSGATVDGTVFPGKANEDNIFSNTAVNEQLWLSINQLPFGYTWGIMISGYRNSGTNQTTRLKVEDTATPAQTFNYSNFDALSNATFANRFTQTGILREEGGANRIRLRFGLTGQNGRIQWMRLRATRTITP